MPVWRAKKLIEALEAEGYTRAQINAAARVRSETFTAQIRLGTMRSLEKAYQELTS